MDTDQTARRAKRLKIFEPFAMLDGAGERRAHLLDISETGALVHCDALYEDGATVELRIKGRAFGARIAWAKSPRLGVTFTEPLAASVIRSLIER